MKKLLSLTLLSALLLATSGCVARAAYTRHSRYQRGYYDDRRTYRDDRPVYRDDSYYRRRDVRVYDTPSRRHGDLRVIF